MTDGSIGHNLTDNTISITAQDKMCLLSGEVGGELQAPAELHRYQEWDDATEEYIYKEFLLYDIIRNAIIVIGGESPGKVLINDIPSEMKVPLQYIGDESKYYDINNNEVVNPSDLTNLRVLNPGDFAGYRMETVLLSRRVDQESRRYGNFNS